MFLRTFLIHSSAVLIKRKCVKSKAFYKKFNNISIDIPEFSVAVLKRTFREHNIGYEDGFTCFITDCPFCNSGKNVKPKAYINKTTGMYMCSNCKRHGEWNELQACINTKRKRMDFRDLKLFKEGLEDIRNSTKPLKDLTESQLELILREFQLPVISPTSISNLDVRINKTDTTLYFPLENVESQIVGYRTLQSITNGETILPNNTCGGLLTAKMRRTRDTAVVVPNIADFLILLNASLKINIICLPDNVNSLSQYFLPSFERFKKLILWLGADINSWNSAKHFAKKLGEKRCLFVRPNEAQLLPHLDDKQDFKSVIDSAEPIWHKSIITFAGLRSDVLSDLQNVDKVQGVKWKRYPTLNKILKGHRRGELTVITGPTGSGKTTFISEYSLDLAMQGVNTLWGSFEIRNARLAKTMLQQMALIPLDENLHLFDKIADKFEKLPIYYMTFHGQQSIKVVMEAVEHATYVHDISHVIIDNVQFMMGISEEQKHMDRFWKQDAIIASFRTFATRKNCHVTLVIHPRKERHDEDLTTSSIFGGAKASQEADNVLIIQDKRLTSIKGKKYLQVAKNRYSGDLGIMALDFDKKTLSFAPKKIKKDADEKACKQSRNEEEIIEGLDL